MKTLIRLLTRNWFEKMLALLLAAMLWSVIASETTSEIAIEAPLEFRNIPPQLEITGEAVNTVEVRLRGSSNLVKEITPRDVSAVVDLRGMVSGEKIIPLVSENVQAPFGVEVVRVTPSRVYLNLERTISRRLPVTPTIVGEPAPGHQITRTLVVPGMVEVEGPESRVTPLRAVSTAPIRIDHQRTTLETSVDLDVPDPLVRLRRISTADVRIEIEAKEED